MGRRIATGLFSSVGSIVVASDDPTTETANRLALSQTFYDEKGQVWKTQRHKIDDAEAERLIEHDSAQWANENPEMLALARDLRQAGYRTAILSNMESRLLALIRQRLPWLDEFEVQIFSCEVGTVKPEPAIYLECCRRLGCEPHEALFLDDKKVNTEAAKRVGMESYVFHSAADEVMLTGEQEITVAELRAMLLNGR